MIVGQKSLRLCNDFIDPFVEKTIAYGMSFGCSLAGYDIRIDAPIDLKPGEFGLASSYEKFDMPPNWLGIVHDKSTWARKGLSVFNTVIEPGWCGFLTLELVNHSKQPIYIFGGMPIAQVVFHWIDEATDGYTGKYQNQEAGPQPARYEDN